MTFTTPVANSGGNKYVIDGANLTNIASAEVYGFTGLANVSASHNYKQRCR